MKLTGRRAYSTAVVAIMLAWTLPAAAGDRYNKPGNILIADQFNNRVLEVNPSTHEILWSFGDASSTAGPTSVVAPNDFQRAGPLNLIAGTGAPAGAEPSSPPAAPTIA